MSMRETKINHPIIESYVLDFANNNEISLDEQKDQHSLFEKYVNNLILINFGDDLNADYNDMDVKTAFEIDGIAIFVDGKIVLNKEDIDELLQNRKRIEVEFFFIQTKTTPKFERSHIIDFFSAIRRFFSITECDIPELKDFWETKNYLYTKSGKFKELPKITTIFVTLSASELDKDDVHLNSAINLGKKDILDLNLVENINSQFFGIKEIMDLHKKIENEMEKTIKLEKTLIPFPKDKQNVIKSGYFGLVKLEEYIKLLVDDLEKPTEIKKGIFNDNIRDYLGSNEKVEVNQNMKDQLLGEQSYLFGLLNNGITIIADEIILTADEISLRNYQIVNGCQTSNVILETFLSISNKENIFIPIRFISTEDEDAKNSIIKATNSQTELKKEQLLALSPIQKAIEQYYETQKNIVPLYYERRTGQYRQSEIQKSKIVTIPIQIKCVATFFFDLPHEVSGQYGKVERQTRGKIFKEEDYNCLECYFMSSAFWYKIERFITSNSGKKFRRARWHILMIIKYLTNNINESLVKDISKKTCTYVKPLQDIIMNDEKVNSLILKGVNIIENCFSDLSDRKLFEKQSTTNTIIKYMQDNNLINSFK